MKNTLKACAFLVAASGLAMSATTASALEPRAASAQNTAAITGKAHTPIKLAKKATVQKKIVVAGRRGRRGRRGAAIGLGIIAGVATAAILSSRAHAHRRHYNSYGYTRSRRHYNRCDRWEYRCHELGVRRACRKFYNRCRY
ncbi:MAG: hypothetical protein ACRBCJ_03050 [Hyphomicrobiaceae bacterium]